MRVRRSVIGAAAGLLMLATTGTALADDIADKQGWCKKQQGSSSCAGQSECSTRGQQEAPRGQAKKC